MSTVLVARRRTCLQCVSTQDLMRTSRSEQNILAEENKEVHKGVYQLECCEGRCVVISDCSAENIQAISQEKIVWRG